MATSLYDQLETPTGYNYRYQDVPELKELFLENVQKTGNRLGSGAFGVVDELSVGGTLYAGKTLHSALLDAHNEGMERIIKRFISECKMVSQIRHPNIVQFMGLCMFSNSIHPSLVMEKMDLNLENVLSAYSDLPLPLIVRILMDIVKGLIYLHGKSPPIIHCDLTARNVLVNTSMVAKIADLGNALMIDPAQLSSTLSRTPGTLPYMPPEAILYKPKYDSMLDMFSFGHLGLFAATQKYPGNLLPPTYMDPSTEKLQARSEVERREEYVSVLVAKLSKNHAVTKIIFQCLHNLPEKRLTATEVMKMLESAYQIEEDPYSRVNLLDLINEKESNLESQSTTLSDSLEYSSLNIRIEGIKNKGEVGQLDVYRTVKWNQDWRTQTFQIKNGFLKYFNINKMDKPLNELDLSLVVCVVACPSRDSTTAFHFEVHFSVTKGSPWILQAQSQDDRICWMEAIQPGSSTVVRSPKADEAFIKDDRHSYENFEIPKSHDQPPPELSAVVTYDELVTTVSHKAQAQEPLLTEPAREYDEPILMSSATTSCASSSTQSQPETFPSNKEDSGGDDGKVYYNIPDELDQEHLYAEIDQTDPSEGAATPEEVDEDNLEMQLWLLLQIQKMMQKMDCGIVTPLSPRPAKRKANNLPRRTQSQCVRSKAKSPLTTSSPDPPSQAVIQKVINNEDMESKPTRQHLYENLDTINKAKTESLPPPIPPRTYQVINGHKSSKTVSKPALPARRPQSHQWSQTNTLPSCTAQPAARPKPPPVQLQPKDIQVCQHQIELRAAICSMKPAHSTSVPGLGLVISTLKANSRAITSSHLVTDGNESTHGSRKRPEWAKAKTQNFDMESTLADLRQKALFLPRSTLDQLEDIGHGQYGKVFKGRYNRPGGPGYPVAIKTIKKYESEKERDSFLKEMNIISKLMHPNIVRLFGLVQQDDPWIVLEFMPHGDLKRFLTKNKKPTEKLIKYMLDVATGMHYISEKGLVHRDLAARNVMVSGDEICKVGDFGLLRELPKDDTTIYVAQTALALPIRWMAPESLVKREFSPASDMWSFGVVMWEMYNPSKLPYKGLNNMDVTVGVNQDLRLTIPEEYPPTVKKIMKACWQQSPSKRPSFLLIASLLTNVYFGAE